MSLPTPSQVVADPDAWDGVVSAFVDLQRRKAALEAEELRLLADATGVAIAVEPRGGSRFADRSIPLRSLIADVAVASRLSEWTVKRTVGDAADLCERFAEGVAALAEGRITRRHLAAIHDAGVEIEDDDVRATYLRVAVERAEETTPGRLGPVVAAISAQLNPLTIDERHEDANAQRGVWVRDKSDAMSDLILTIPSVLAHAGLDRATQFAQSIIAARSDTEQGADDRSDEDQDVRIMDQLRADVLTDLLLTGAPAECAAGDGVDAIRGVVQVTVPVLTAAGVGDEPSLLAGVGPIDGDTARRLLGNTKGWDRVMTSPVTGAVLAVDRYKPCKPLRRLLRARDERCRFAGCRRSAQRCESDHTIPYAEGGATCVCNLAALCKHHHIIKHHGDWTVRQRGGGVLEWTSPSGRLSTDRPEPMVRFVPDHDIRSDPPPELVPPGTARQWLADPDGVMALRYDPHEHGAAGF